MPCPIRSYLGHFYWIAVCFSAIVVFFRISRDDRIKEFITDDDDDDDDEEEEETKKKTKKKKR
jgi:hypothetical protein